MSAAHPPSPDIDAAILLEAADWLVLLQSSEVSERERTRLARWCERSAAHAAAWARAQNMLGTLEFVPSRLAHDTLLRPGHAAMRRHALRMGVLAMALPAGWVAWRLAPWQEWSADLSTSTGEQRTLTLADGTRLVLNTGSSVNVLFTAAERRLTLVAGEILVTTSHRDPAAAPRPFIVDTANGSMRALGTRFSVRHTDTDTRLAVFTGAVQVRAAGGLGSAVAQVIVREGEQLRFTASAMEPAQPVEPGAALWERGMLLARDMRLDELTAELKRYHRGVLRCDPAVAGLTVSGAFPVTNTLASLDMLEKSLPVRVESVTPYWITLKAR
ncbi:FecR domain-containing protein [Xylophilus sp. GW821-FHT01B05]